MVPSERKVSEAEWFGSPFFAARGFEPLATAHSEKDREEEQLVERNETGVSHWSSNHSTDEVERDRLLRAFGGVVVAVTFPLAP
jgi:hypothetical protein